MPIIGMPDTSRRNDEPALGSSKKEGLVAPTMTATAAAGGVAVAAGGGGAGGEKSSFALPLPSAKKRSNSTSSDKSRTLGMGIGVMLFRAVFYRSNADWLFPTRLLNGGAAEARQGDRSSGGISGDPNAPQEELLASANATFNRFRSSLIRANFSIFVFTVVHLAVYTLFVVYRFFVIVRAKQISESYSEWTECAFINFEASQPDAWKSVCGSFPFKRPPYGPTYAAFLIISLYGSLIAAMHFTSITSEFMRLTKGSFELAVNGLYNMFASDYQSRESIWNRPMPGPTSLFGSVARR
jgi:hypothetical protein